MFTLSPEQLKLDGTASPADAHSGFARRFGTTVTVLAARNRLRTPTESTRARGLTFRRRRKRLFLAIVGDRLVWKTAVAFVRAYHYLDTLPLHREKEDLLRQVHRIKGVPGASGLARVA